MKAIVFVVMLLALYGPKIGSIDLSILGGVLGLLLVLRRRRLVVPGEYAMLLVMCIALAGYAMVVTIASGSDDFYMMLRQMRATIALVLLGIVFFNTGVRPESVLKLLILALLVHVGAIAIQLGAPGTQDIFAAIWLYDKGYQPLRAFGLTAGFDGSGYLALMGAILCLASMLYVPGNKARYLLGFYVFCVAALFTSRLSILFAVCLGAVVTFALVLKGNRWVKAAGIATLSIGSYYFVTVLFPIFAATVPLLEAWFDVSDYSAADYQSYARGTEEVWLGMFWWVSSDLSDSLFGTGINPSETDVGYIKLLSMTGLIGLLLTIGPYLYLLKRSLRLHARANTLRLDGAHGVNKALALALAVMIAFTFIINLKSLYFFTRTFFELNVILFFTLLAAARRGGSVVSVKFQTAC